MYIPDAEYKIILEKMPTLCVDLLIIHKGKCLLLNRNTEPAKDKWWFPGGRLLKMELITDACKRKAREETNLNCKFIKIICIEETIFTKNENMHTDIHTVNVCCELATENIESLQIDLLHHDYKWVDRQSDLFHKAVNHPLSLVGIPSNEAGNCGSEL